MVSIFNTLRYSFHYKLWGKPIISVDIDLFKINVTFGSFGSFGTDVTHWIVQLFIGNTEKNANYV